jgi:hypothetical protein
MLQSGGYADLLQEPLGGEASRQLGMQHLERDGSSVLPIARPVHRGCSATADFLLDLVPVTQSLRDAQTQIDQAGPSLLRRAATVATALGTRIGVRSFTVTTTVRITAMIAIE